MYENDTVHREDEFGNFPWDAWLEKLETTATWSILGTAYGKDLDHRLSLNFLRDDGSRAVWIAPEGLQALVNQFKQYGADEAKQKIRAAIGSI